MCGGVLFSGNYVQSDIFYNVLSTKHCVATLNRLCHNCLKFGRPKLRLIAFLTHVYGCLHFRLAVQWVHCYNFEIAGGTRSSGDSAPSCGVQSYWLDMLALLHCVLASIVYRSMYLQMLPTATGSSESVRLISDSIQGLVSWNSIVSWGILLTALTAQWDVGLTMDNR